jgi:hypothetical protein
MGVSSRRKRSPGDPLTIAQSTIDTLYNDAKNTANRHPEASRLNLLIHLRQRVFALVLEHGTQLYHQTLRLKRGLCRQDWSRGALIPSKLITSAHDSECEVDQAGAAPRANKEDATGAAERRTAKCPAATSHAAEL